MTRFIEVRLENPDAPSPLARRMRCLPLPEPVKAGFVIAHIERQLPPLYAVTELTKMREIMHPDRPDPFRKIHLYYEPDREKQEFEDSLFAFMLPKTSEAISRAIGQPAERWQKTTAIARRISTLPIFESMSPLIHCRAKSNFSIFRKMNKKNIDTGEIFDRLGVQVVVESIEEAYMVKEALLSAFTIVPDHAYLRPGKFRSGTHPSTHPSLRDTLQSSEKKERAIRINLQNGNDIFEVKITTREILHEYYSDPTFLAEMTLYHEYRLREKEHLQIDPAEL